MGESNHDLKARELQVTEILSNILANPVIIRSILRYSDDFDLADPRDLIDRQTALSLISTDNGVNRTSKDNTDLTGNNDDGWVLPFVLDDNGFPVGVRVKNTDTNEVQFVGFGNYVNPIGFNSMPWGDTIPQEMIVFSFGEGVPPTPMPVPVIILQPTPTASIIRGFTLTATIIATDATNYQWSVDGIEIPGQNTQTLTIEDFDESKNGSYTCEAYNSTGFDISDPCVASVRIPVAGEILAINNSIGDITYKDDFDPVQVLPTQSYVDKNPMSNNQSFQVFFPVGTTLEYRRFNADGTPNGSPLIMDNPPSVALGASLMSNTLGYEFYIRNT